MNYQLFRKFLVFTCLLVVACQQDSSISDVVNRLIKEDETFFKQHSNSTMAVVIIPRVGCSSCIGIADHFFKETVEFTTNIKFVFTKIQSEKTLKIRLGESQVKKQNVLLDRKGRYAQKELDSLYPTLIILENGKVKETKTITPQNKEMISSLKKKLALTINQVQTKF